MRVWGEGAKSFEVSQSASDGAEKTRRSKEATQKVQKELLPDARHEVAAPPPVDKKQKKKRINRISIGRHSNGTRDDPAASATAAAPIDAHNTLSRLLFSKPNMEQRDQVKVVYRQFGSNASDVLLVEKEDGMPSPEESDHVVIKVQVRNLQCRAPSVQTWFLTTRTTALCYTRRHPQCRWTTV
jgi:hypothetical protein